LPTSSEVRSVLQSCESALRAYQYIIDTSTGSPEAAIEFGELCARHRAEYAEATILGSSEVIRSGNAVVMLGGQEAARIQAELWVRRFANQVFHVGPLGQASRMKLVVNLVLGLNRAALAEGLAFAEALDLDLPQTLAVLKSGAAYSQAMDAKGQKMLDRDFTPQARLAQHHKDVRLMLEAAAAAGMSLPLAETHDRLLALAEAAGHTQSDNCAILAAYDRRGGPELGKSGARTQEDQ
jgi:3-hydroxyisobutyrate dehydrogenase-like beta-hydroxyacid dehydrogenase